MDVLVIQVLTELRLQRCIGKKHIPEKVILKKICRRLSSKELKKFHKDYKQAHQYIIRTKKRTHKDMDWHISINPRKLKKVEEIITQWD